MVHKRTISLLLRYSNMKFLLFLTHFIVLLFSAYFLFNFGVRWVQVIGYNLAFNEPVANSLNHSINIYFKLIAITSLAISFLLFFNVFVAALRCCYGWRKFGYSGNIYLLWMRYKAPIMMAYSKPHRFIFIFYAHYCWVCYPTFIVRNKTSKLIT